jgi:predicted nucleic acid-binding protein
MIVVLDASGAAEIAEQTKSGIDMINALMEANKVIAPDLYITEITNYTWKHYRKEKDISDVHIKIIEDCIDYIHEYTGSEDLWKDALLLAREYDHPVYDMLYAALARRHDAVLLTMDTGLRLVCEKASIKTKDISQD